MLFAQYFIDKRKDRADVVRGILALGLLFILAIAGLGQQKPKAILVDEFSQMMNCEDVPARFDNFLLQLHNNPNSTGIAIITPKAGEPWFAIKVQQQIYQWYIFRKYDSKSPNVSFSKPATAANVQFWLMPAGADVPEYDAAQPGEIFAGLAKPFIYNTEFGGEVCPAINPKLLANLVNSNPNIDVRIVVREKTPRSRMLKMNEWLRRLVSREGIPRERIRVMLSRRLKPDFPYQDVEFWIVPVKKR